MSVLGTALDKVVGFYRKCNIEVEQWFLNKVENYAVSKQEYFKEVFSEQLTIEVPVTPEESLRFFWESDLGVVARRDLLRLIEGGEIQPEALNDPSILENRIKVGKQYKKLTKVLKEYDQERWDDVRCGQLFDAHTPRKTIVSIDPYEFQTASENCGWESCFRVDGEYHSSVWAYYGYPKSLIIKEVNSSGTAVARCFVLFSKSDNGYSIGRVYGCFYYPHLIKVVEGIADKLGVRYGVCTDDPRIDYDSSNTYLDAQTFASVAEGESFYAELESGINCEGYCADDGYFSGNQCDCCGDRVQGELTEVDNCDMVCEGCLEEHYVWSDTRDVYMPRGIAVYLEDVYDWVYEDDEYYVVDGAYYRDIPDGYILCDCDGDIYPEDSMIYITDTQEYVHDRYSYRYTYVPYTAEYFSQLPEEYAVCMDTDEAYPKHVMYYVEDCDGWSSVESNLYEVDGLYYKHPENIPEYSA